MIETMYDRLGGEPFFRALVSDFYDGVKTDPLLRPMYPESDLDGAIERLTLFLMQYWGGPETYSELRGHPRLRMRHAAFEIDIKAKDAWLTHMQKALDNRHLQADLDAEIRTYLVNTANFLVNTQSPEVRAITPETTIKPLP
ncbi:MAG: globin [Candidatus Nanopelagicales bacterium]